MTVWQTARDSLGKGRAFRGSFLPATRPMLWSSRSWRAKKPWCENAELTRNMPSLPNEIWRIIIRYAIRLAGSTVIDIEDPFSSTHDEDLPEEDPGIFQDRASLAQVSSLFRALVLEVSVEYIIIQTADELKAAARLLKHSKPNESGRRVGEWTLRIDLKILGSYNVKRVATLLQHAPNTQVFVNHNGRDKGTLGRVPKQMMGALMMYGKNIRRIDFGSIHEAPALFDLIDLSRHVRQLQTLRLLCVHSYPIREDMVKHLPVPIFPKLKTLSLGIIPEPPGGIPETYAMVWDPLLAFLSVSEVQLPCLERFETDIFPDMTTHFFCAHGRKLRMFRTTTWSADNVLPDALDRCPNLEKLVLSHSSETMQLPTFHPSIRQVCIAPFIDGFVKVPDRVFQFAVLAPLEELLRAVEEMSVPCLTEVRIRNSGAFVDLEEHAVWLRNWWRRWNIQGVKFCDKVGMSYEDAVTEGERLLNTVRG